jgi:hypothetical protein
MIKDLSELIRTMKACKSFYLHNGENPVISRFYNPEEECSEFITNYWRANNCPPETEPCTMFFPVSSKLKLEAGELIKKAYAVKCMFCKKIDTPLKFLHHMHELENNSPPTEANATSSFLCKTKFAETKKSTRLSIERQRPSANDNEQTRRNLACPGCKNSEQFVLFLPGCLPQ